MANSQTFTLLLTDLADSTALVQRLGDERATVFWAKHDHHARELLAQHDGREIDRSDGFFLLFNRAADAVRFASGYHRLTAELGVSARVGLHTAPVTLRHNPPDEVARGAKPIEVDSVSKPLAARIMALAAGGRTLLSADTAAALDVAALHPLALQRQGHYRLKGIAEPVELFELATEVTSCPPPADGDKGYRVVRVGETWRPVREVRHNLLPERDAFVGRGVELRALAERLEAGVRLLTVMGPGGTGKTRLIQHYAAVWLGEWPGGAYFCDLSEVHDLVGIQAAVAVALGVPLSAGDAGAQLGHAIAARGRCLVILDNFEQVQSHANATVGRWLDGAPQASFVVTSRERLHLAGEELYALEPMSPSGDALALFEARARQHQRGFAIDDDARATVVEIARLLDGLPLAIELAAARVGVLAPAQILARMKNRFALLAGARGAAARQATLRAAIDWSWDLLALWERAAFAQCAVFDGGFTLDAAEAVVRVDAWPEAPPVLDLIQSLVDKSLLRAWQPRTSDRLDIDEPFFGMYLSIHEYATEKLHSLGEPFEAETQRRHGEFFARFGTAEARDALMTHGGIKRYHLLAREFDNLIGACRRAIRDARAQTAALCFLGLWSVVHMRGPLGLAEALGREVAALEGLKAESRALVRLALATAALAGGRSREADAVLDDAMLDARQSADSPTLAFALRQFAVARHRQGHNDEALRHFEDARRMQEALGLRPGLGVLLANLANLLMELGHMDEAQATYQAALAIHREVGNRAAEGTALGNLGTLHHELGRLDEARAAYDGALAIHRESGNTMQEATTLCNLGELVDLQGRSEEAAGYYGSALQIHRDIGNRRGEGVVLGQIAELHQQAGDLAQARAGYEAALHIHREVGNRRFEGGVLGNLGMLLAEQGEAAEGLTMVETAEQVAREIDDPLVLAELLCIKGEVALKGGRPDTARTALAEAQAAAQRLGATAESHLARSIEHLRAALSTGGGVK